MGEWVKVKADDGHELGAYVAKPAQAADRRAGGGAGDLRREQVTFAAWPMGTRRTAFWRSRRRCSTASSATWNWATGEADMKKAFGLYPKLNPNVSLLDIAAAFHHVKQAGKATGVLGFCYGGLIGLALGDARRGFEDAAGLLRGLLPRRHRQVCDGGAGVPGDAALWRRMTTTSARTRSRRCGRRIRRWRSIVYRGRGPCVCESATARATTRLRPSWRMSGRWRF